MIIEEDKLTFLRESLNSSNFTIIITGAGISNSIGINDMEHLNLGQTLQTSLAPLVKARPEHSYKLLRKSFLTPMFEIGPSLTHKKLALFEKQGLIQGIITTNIDHLHSLAGSENVAEIQGSYAINKCLSCGKHFDDVRIWNIGKAPRCNICNGVITSFPVYSGVSIYEKDYRQAEKWISYAELVIVVGSKGMYGSYLEKLKLNTPIIQINPNKTQFDSLSQINIREKSDDIFSLIN